MTHDPVITEVRPRREDIRRLCGRHRWKAWLGLLELFTVDIEGTRLTLAYRRGRVGQEKPMCGG